MLTANAMMWYGFYWYSLRLPGSYYDMEAGYLSTDLINWYIRVGSGSVDRKVDTERTDAGSLSIHSSIHVMLRYDE